MKHTEAIIARLTEHDGMPAAYVDARWTIPEGMDYPWSDLRDLLTSLEGVVRVEWVGGPAGLLIDHATPAERVVESFRPLEGSDE